MSGFETIPHDEWSDLRDLIDLGCAGKPWPVAAAGMDLRWLTGERRINRLRAEDFPTVRALADRWRWNRAAADRFIRGATWQDPLRQCTLEWLRGDRVRPRVRQDRDGGETEVRQDRDGMNEPTPETNEQVRQDQDKSETEVRQKTDSRALSPRASTGAPSTGHPVEERETAPASGPVRVEQPPEPEPQPTLIALPAPKPIDFEGLWSALTAWTPKPGAWKLTAERRKALNARVKDHDEATVYRVAEWVRTSTHERAAFLRDRGDVMTLLRPEKFATYAAMSASPVTVAKVNGRPVVDYMGGFKELDEWEQHERGMLT